jgi:hypothetical protein
MRSMRLSQALLLTAALTACSDGILAPNTDVGLSVWAEVSPASLSIRDTLTPLRIRVYVANKSNHAISVVGGGPPYVFTNDPTASHGLWGSYRIANSADPLHAGPSVDWFGQPVYTFSARNAVYNETKLTLHEWKSGGWPLTPGVYWVRSWFNAREGRNAAFAITP